jgi:hypothetical protein
VKPRGLSPSMRDVLERMKLQGQEVASWPEDFRIITWQALERRGYIQRVGKDLFRILERKKVEKMRLTYTVSFTVDVDLSGHSGATAADIQDTLADSDLADAIQEAVEAHLELAPIPAKLADLHGLTAYRGHG